MEMDITVHWRKIVLTVHRVCFEIIREGVGAFLVMEEVLVWQMLVVEIMYMGRNAKENV